MPNNYYVGQGQGIGFQVETGCVWQQGIQKVAPTMNVSCCINILSFI